MHVYIWECPDMEFRKKYYIVGHNAEFGTPSTGSLALGQRTPKIPNHRLPAVGARPPPGIAENSWSIDLAWPLYFLCIGGPI